MTTITAPAEQKIVDEVPKQLYIGGEWRDGAKGTLSVEDPSTGESLCEVADASTDDAKAALTAAVEAGPEWAAHAPRERGEILRRAFEALVARADDLALLMTLEMGKPLAESKAEIAYAAEFFRWFSEEAVRIDGRYAVNSNGQGRVLTMKQPVGPCLLITPWNFPMAMGTRKIGPAIAAGCTMVVKPAQQTPLSMLMLVKILEEAGLPAGVVNLVTASSSSETMAPLIADQRLRKLSFTGSTEVGRKLMAQASQNLLRLSMELGGNAPFIVFDDADIDAAVDGRAGREDAQHRRGVHGRQPLPRRRRRSPSEFAEKLAEKMGAMKVGRGTEDGVQVGPLIDDDQRKQGRRARRGRDRPRREGGRRRPRPRRRRLLLRPDRAHRRPRRRRAAAARRSSARSRPSRASATRTRRSPPPTTPSTAWSPTCSRTTSSARCA